MLRAVLASAARQTVVRASQQVDTLQLAVHRGLGAALSLLQQPPGATASVAAWPALAPAGTASLDGCAWGLEPGEELLAGPAIVLMGAPKKRVC